MSIADFHFLRPFWLLALIPASYILILLYKHNSNRVSWIDLCDAELLPYLLQEKLIVKKSNSFFISGLICLLSILALAGPTWQRLPTPAFRNDAALVIALSLSASMDATDIKPSRLVKARYKIADLLKQRKDGQTALLVFAGDAFTVTPLTSDTATIISQLEALTTDIMPSQGSNTEIALSKAVRLLQQAGAAQGNVLLVTDNAQLDRGDISGLGPYQMSILAVGTEDGAPIKQSGGGFLKDQKGGIVVSRLDLSTLSQYAEQGHGIFQLVTANDADVDNLSKTFNLVQKDTATTQPANHILQQWVDFGPYLLFLIIPWAALKFRKGLMIMLGLVLLPFPQDSQAMDWQGLWQNDNQQAKQAFNQQQYQQAAEKFENPEWKAAAQYKSGEYQQAAETLKNSQSVDAYFNRGNALAKSGQLEEAIQSYDQALKLDPDHQDAKFNKNLVEQKLQKQQQSSENEKKSDKNDEKQDQKSGKQQDNSSSKQSNQSEDQSEKTKSENQEQSNTTDSKSADEKNMSQTDASKKEIANENVEKEANQKDDEAKKDKEQAKAFSNQETEKKEIDRANEQLLKRIPDEPTGLLKRKFRYQYSQRANPDSTRP